MNGNYIKLKDNDVVVIEGIHGINEKLTPKISRDDKFKIYISCLTQLNIDEHNRISTTDTRLLRRLVRDYNFRGFDARTTINMWPKVMAGEEENIFPYQEEADAMFNTSLDYELAVLKPYAESVLYEVDRSEPCYGEAKRLIQLLDCFLTISPNDIPPNSLLREFIGGSCFYNN
jgi:uridine kinase